MKPRQTTPPPATECPPGTWLPRLLRLLDDQLADAEGLSAMSRRQGEAAAAGEVEKVVAVLEQRQGLVDAMAARAAEMTPFTRDLEGFLRQIAPRYREVVTDKMRRLGAAVGQINRQDEIDLATLERARDRLAQEMAAVGRGRSAVAAYGHTEGKDAPRYQDREG